MLLGSKGTFLTISVSEPDIEKVRKQTGCRLYYELATVTLQVSIPKATERNVQPRHQPYTQGAWIVLEEIRDLKLLFQKTSRLS